MENNNPDPRFAGTIDLETGKIEKVSDNPNLTDNPDASLEDTSGAGGVNEGTGEPGAAAVAATTTTDETAKLAAAEAEKNADYLKIWNEKAGTQYQTIEEAIEEIKSGRGLKEKLIDSEKKLGELSVLDDPFVRDIAKAKKSGIGIELYLEALKMDVDKLDAKQSLKEAFLRRNADLVATDPEFAGMKFEKDYQAKYGKIGEQLDVKGLDEFEIKEKTLEFNRDQDFIKRSLNAEAMQDKKYLNDWKKQHITIPDAPQQAGMTDAQIQQYTLQVDSFVGQNEMIEIPVGDKLKFNFGLKDYKETLKKELLNPLETLKKHGIDVENGIIDPDKLGKLLTAAYVGGNIAKPLSDWAVDARNIEFLKQKVVQPAPTQSIAAGAAAGAEDDLATRFAKGMAAQKASALSQS